MSATRFNIQRNETNTQIQHNGLTVRTQGHAIIVQTKKQPLDVTKTHAHTKIDSRVIGYDAMEKIRVV